MKVHIALIFVSFSFLFACTKRTAPAPALIACNDSISFKQQIMPMIREHCSKCHGVNAGSPPTLSVYEDVAKQANTILETLHGNPVLMPMGKDRLPDSLIHQFECWIRQGKLNN